MLVAAGDVYLSVVVISALIHGPRPLLIWVSGANQVARGTG